MLVPFYSPEKACEAVSAIIKAGITPSILEFMEQDAIDWTMKFIDGINMPIKYEHKAHLLIEVDGNNLDVLYDDCNKITEILKGYECDDDVLFADDQSQKDTLWKKRIRVAEAVKGNLIYKEEDTVVPRYELPMLLKGVKEIGDKYGFKSVCYGHTGDGNLHVNIIKGKLSNEEWNTNVVSGIKEILIYIYITYLFY